MKIELAVLDFDGTITDVDSEAVTFVDGYKVDVAKDLGIGQDELGKRWTRTQTIVEQNPSRYGWVNNGKIVAPAYADPLILSKAVAGFLLDEAGLYLSEQERQNALERYFQDNYGKMDIVFKDDANEFIQTLSDQVDTCIVTNSGTDCVLKKLQRLSSDLPKIPIYGDAKKYVLNSDWEEVPESVEKKWYGRPLFLRRQKYWNVLFGVMEERGLCPEQIAVIGDIYELDLLLPEYKGMRIILTPRNSTPKFEVETVRASPVGYVASTLEEVLQNLNGKLIYR